MFVDFNILNQLGSPSINSNTLANRPAAGQTGRLFVSIDTFALYRDNGTGWDLIGGPGTGTVTGSGAAGQVTYWTGASTVSGNNNLFWDTANERLGIGTTTPGHKLQIDGTGTLFSLQGGSDVYMEYAGNGSTQYRTGYTDNALDYRRWSIYDVTGSKEVLTIDKQSRNVGINYQYSTLTDQPAYTFDVDGTIRATNDLIVDYNFLLKQVTSASTPAGYTGMYADSILNGIRYINGNSAISMTYIFPASGNRLYTFPANDGTVALLSDIPSLSGYVQGSGTTNQVPKFTASGTIGNSLISDSGTIVKCNYATFDKGFILDLANETFIYGNRLGYSSNIKIAGAIQTQSNNGNDDGLKIENQIVTLGDYANILNQQKFTIDQSTLKTYTSYNGNVTGFELDYNAGIFRFGDIVNNYNLEIDSGGGYMRLKDSADNGIDINGPNQIIKIGDYNNTTNNEGIIVDNANKFVSIGDVFGSSSATFGIDTNSAALTCSLIQIGSFSYANQNIPINIGGNTYYIPLYS